MASKRPLERLLLIDRKISSALAMIVTATFFIGWRSQVLTQAWQRWRNFLALAPLGIGKTSCRFIRVCQARMVSRLAASSLTIEARGALVENSSPWDYGCPYSWPARARGRHRRERW